MFIEESEETRLQIVYEEYIFFKEKSLKVKRYYLYFRVTIFRILTYVFILIPYSFPHTDWENNTFPYLWKLLSSV